PSATPSVDVLRPPRVPLCHGEPGRLRDRRPLEVPVFGLILRGAMPAYGRWMMGRHLDGLWVDGLDRAAAVAAREPVIFAVNHVCWWDGILMLTLAPRLGIDNRFLVDAGSVDKLAYLKHFGAIGVDRSTM